MKIKLSKFTTYSLENWLMHLSLEEQAEQKQVAKELKAQHIGVKMDYRAA